MNSLTVAFSNFILNNKQSKNPKKKKLKNIEKKISTKQQSILSNHDYSLSRDEPSLSAANLLICTT